MGPVCGNCGELNPSGPTFTMRLPKEMGLSPPGHPNPRGGVPDHIGVPAAKGDSFIGILLPLVRVHARPAVDRHRPQTSAVYITDAAWPANGLIVDIGWNTPPVTPSGRPNGCCCRCWLCLGMNCTRCCSFRRPAWPTCT